MKTKDIAKQHGFNLSDLDRYIKQHKDNYSFKENILTSAIDVEENDVDDVVSGYKAYVSKREEEKVRAELEKQRIAEEERQKLQDKKTKMAKMLITSGFNFDGYRITKYSGFISGDSSKSIARGGGLFSGVTDPGKALMNTLSEIRREALSKLKESAYALGCNAVIGVDYDYITLDPETASPTGGTIYLPYVFGVSANGNAVVIEKE